ncbi:Cascade antiviral complex protein [Methylophaga lonarensis MPL]|uniref:Cascade antiviral complex protein n=1 Tax=Methylophaga lonarensis MPL TaxID=1286106 RepID=M7NZ72_9GAMM|nr:type I-E CRISPR-associated protein Cse1/CasA [Methylophaga lonarensis]EMR12516.1 Cascade antiviral complex protein [Methylophaga lonarensis MPL]
MNLLKDAWIPVQQAGLMEKITLQQLLCNEKQGELCLPRDDMEFACLQLLVAITQVLFPPADKAQLVQRLKQPLTRSEYDDGCEGKLDWFDLDHPETPFMQFRGVNAKELTPMDKLMAGVADGTNKTFVNPQGLIEGLCAGCVSIVLYNTAYNCPSMGGGFKSGMRGSTPITVLIRGDNLSQTVWHNVLTAASLKREMPCYEPSDITLPNYIEGLRKDSKLSASTIGLAKGLFWQPARFELAPIEGEGVCSCCGQNLPLYTGFKKEKFSYTIEGVWPHPLSARTFTIKAGQKEEKFPSFTTSQPSWVHLAKLVVDKDNGKEGYHPAPVITQLKSFGAKRLNLMVGGYRNNQATVLERRHEMYSLASDWQENTSLVDELITLAQEYKKALRKALYLFGEGVKDSFAGAGVNLTDQYEAVFYQSTEQLIQDTLAEISYTQPSSALDSLSSSLKARVTQLFDQAIFPYRQEPKMLKALASSRRLLNKYLKDLEPHGGNHE